MMNTSVLKDVIQTLEDGHKGFTEGAEKLDEDNQTDIASTFREFAGQRARFAAELRDLGASRGIDLSDEGGTATAALHRAWMGLRDAFAGDDPDGVLKVAEQGEDHAVSEYEKALDHDDLDPEVRNVLARQYTDVRAAHDRVRSLRDSHVS